jgi:hypothetical protein
MRRNYAAPLLMANRFDSRSAIAAAARLPVHFLVLATVSFAGGLAAAPFVIADAVVFFYNPAALALVHTFALGWITAAIMGVMYRYVPALTRTPLRFPRLGFAQLALFFIGASGMVTHFALGQWSGVWSAALVAIASIVLFAVNMFACLWRRLGRAAAETGIAISIVFLLIAACAGFLLAFDKSRNFLGGGVISNIAGHADLAAIGWVALAICAVSYRMLPAFLLPRAQSARLGGFQLGALAIAVAGLAFALFSARTATIPWSAMLALAFAAYLLMLGRMVSTRRAPLAWPVRHVVAGAAFLAVTAALGLILTSIGAQSAIGARIAAIYGFCGLLGFFSNVIIGVSYNLFPGFVIKARSARGWRAAANADLAIAAPRALIFAAFNTGIIVACIGFIAANAAIAQVGALLMAAGGIVYCVAALRTLGGAYWPRLPNRTL